jgi:cephalosporin hydroxylase
MTNRETIEGFHKLFYDSALDTWASTFWLGVATEKFPCDLWVYQEIIQELRPDYIVETGTRFGGSAVFMASLCELLGHGHVITIDLAGLASTDNVRPSHPRITYVTGSSTAPETVAVVRAAVEGSRTVMVILDSDHHMTHVLDEMRIYAELVTTGSYLIVEDTNINGHPVASAFGHGPMEAAQLFLADTGDFVVDRSREKFLVTFNPGGFLRKLAGESLEVQLLRVVDQLEIARRQADEAEQAVRNTARELDEAIRALQSSQSWRITAPLRRLRRALRR